MSKCQLFQDIAFKVWNEISSNHERGNRLDENGITRNTIISSIQDYVEGRHAFEVFAQIARDEVNRGADIELYLQTSHQRFVRILLQSKIMELNGTFTNLNRYSGSTQRKQYDTLIQHSRDINSKAYYLFFNGIRDYHKNFSDCAGQHDEKQFGCALEEATSVKQHCEDNSTGTWGDSNNSKPIGVPWRKLTCCEQINTERLKEYSFSEINANPYFERLFAEQISTSYITPENLERLTKIEEENVEIHKLGWSPFARIFLTRNHYRMVKRDGFLRMQP